MSSCKELENKLVGDLQRTLSIIADQIRDLEEEEICTGGVTSSSIGVVSSLLGLAPKNKVMEIFLECHNDWSMVKEKNVTFLKDTLPERFKERGLNVDTRIVYIPFECYYRAKKSKMWASRMDDYPLIQDDLDMIWQSFESLVSTAKDYVAGMRRFDDSYMSEIQL